MPGTVGRQLSTLWLFVVLTTAWVVAVALFAIGEALWASAVLLAATLHLRARVKAMRRVRSVRRRWSPEVGARARRPTKAAPKATVRIGRDPATGRIDGVVLAGPHAGLGLRALPLDSLLAVAGTIDSADVAALEHMTLLLDELHPGWSADAEPAAPDAAQAELSAARSLLGVEAGATQEEICAAHRRLIRRVHPDVGGSAALTAEVNAAKDLLLSVA